MILQRQSRAKPKQLHRKPGPKPKPQSWAEGRDYYCGGCAGHKTVPCDCCVGGCGACKGVGYIDCPTCNGGAVPTRPPDYL